MTRKLGAGIDLAGYLDRIGYRGAAEPTVETLHALVAGHVRAIPFENLDPLMGMPVDDLGPAALSDKLVRRRRGGYCYEHNGLMAFALERIGYGVERLAARVVWMRPDSPDDVLPAMTHQLSAVTVPGSGTPFLVDVGFGGQTPTAPLRLVDGAVQHTPHEPYRVVGHREGHALEVRIGEQWRPLYVFSSRPQPMIDLEVGSWYVSTHPASNFVVGLTAALVTDDGRWNLRGRNLAVHRPGGTERVRFDTAEQVLDALTERFGIDVAELGDRGPLAARVGEVLDT